MGSGTILKEKEATLNYKIPLVLTLQPDGGYTVTSPLVPELVTERESVEEVLDNVKDALLAVAEIYEDLGLTLPQNVRIHDDTASVSA